MSMKTNRIILSLIMLLTSAVGVKAQQSTHWQCDIYKFEHDMTLYFVLKHNDEPLTNYGGYEVAAFVDDECRGVAEFQTVTLVDHSNVTFGYLRIRSNQLEGEKVSFRVYQTSTGKVFWPVETLTFKAMDMQGLPSAPYVLNMADVRKGDVNGDGKVNSVDLSMLIDRILGKKALDFINAAGDINNDGRFNSVDYSLLINLILNQ